MKLKKINKKQGSMIFGVLIIALFALVLAYPTQVQLFFGGFFGSITGTPFLTQEIADGEFALNCAFAGCFDSVNNRMEGSFGIPAISVTYFGETNLGQDYDVRAVACEARADISGGSYTDDLGGSLVSQIQTKDGKWIDYYYSAFPVRIQNERTVSPIQITSVKKVPSTFTSEDLWIWPPVSNQIMQLEDGQRFITNKVRCALYRNLHTYNKTIFLTETTIKVYGTAVEPTCTDGIKNQDEEEIDCGGICNSCGLTGPVVVCGDSICSENESEANCPTDCSTIVFEEPVVPTKDTPGFHEEDIPNVGLMIIADDKPTDLSLSGILVPVFIIGILVSILGIVYLVFIRKQ